MACTPMVRRRTLPLSHLPFPPPSRPLTPPHFDAGFEKPSAVQQRAIKPIVSGRDVIAQAQSGTGKTATFSIAALQSIDTTQR